MDEVEAVLLVEVDDDLGVGAGVKAVAMRFKFAAQLGIIVDLAVEDRPHGAVLVVNGLLARVEIND